MDGHEIEARHADFEALLDYLKRSRAFDFTGYKRSSLMRRVDKRMLALEIADYGAYQDYLEVHPDEFAYLFNTILINVTAFFRDPRSWEYLAQEIVPRILSAKPPEDPIRIWSAGCASGEEAYTLAMTLAEALGSEQFRNRVKIYATDIDEEALGQARQACYSVRQVSGVPPELLERYFERTETHYCFQKDLRRAVIFGRHDFIQDAPISRVDLIVCRNALMYLNSEIRAKILNRLHFALNDGGYLFLGKAELLFSHTAFFTPVDLKRRIFAKLPKPFGPGRAVPALRQEADLEGAQMTTLARLQEVVFDHGPVAQIVINPQGAVTMVNERARALFHLTARDLGRPLQDLEFSYRPVELRSLIERACADQRTATVKEAVWPPSGGQPNYLDVQVHPLYDSQGALLGTNVLHLDVTRDKQLQEELQAANEEL